MLHLHNGFVTKLRNMLHILLIGYFTTCGSAEGGADVVLSCALVEEGVMDEMGGGSPFSRTSATLVLRDVAVSPDQLPETLTPFIPPTEPDPDVTVFEARVSSPQIPYGDQLLHADCNEQEVVCEMSRYTPGGSQDETGPAHFIVSLHLEGAPFSSTLLLQTVAVDTDPSGADPIQNKMGLPLSKSGSLLTDVVFLLFTSDKSVSAPLRGSVLLNCGFRGQEMPTAEQVGLEWWVQHKGKGRRVLTIRTDLTNPDESSDRVRVERHGSSVDPALLVGEGNASITLTKLKISDEGTYICTVDVGFFHAQQVVQLSITQPPSVSLSEDKLVIQDNLPQKVRCDCKNFYPIDAKMEWLYVSPADTEPKPLPEKGSLSGHRQHSDGTFSLSSYLNLLPSSFPAGTTIVCRVSHPSLPTPISVSLLIEQPELAFTDSYWMVLVLLVITVLFFYQIMR